MSHYRFNVDPIWENFSGLVEYSTKSVESRNEYYLNTNKRIALNFAIITIESFMNKHQRQLLSSIGATEDAIYKELRQVNFRDKVKKWPEKFCNGTIVFPANTWNSMGDFFDFLAEYKEVRDELTHPKNKDHSIYPKLNELNIIELSDKLALCLASMLIAISGTFPYWLLGWNYVGMNGDYTWPILGNNGNSFYYSLVHLRCPFLPRYSQAYGFDRENMASLDNFQTFKSWLDSLTFDLEPYYERLPGFGGVPLLTRRWWDVEAIRKVIPPNIKFPL